MYLYFDPVMVAMPVITGDAEQDWQAARQYTKQLIAWYGEMTQQDRRHHLFLSALCMQALLANDYLPKRNVLQPYLEQVEPEGALSAKDLTDLAYRLATNSPHLEYLFGGIDFQSIEVDEETFEIHPDLLRRLPPAVVPAFRCSLGWIAWLRVNRHLLPDDAPDPADLLLVTHPTGDVTTTSLRAEVRSDEPVTVEHTLPLITHPKDLLRYSSLQRLWHDPQQAVTWLLDKADRKATFNFHFGPNFVDYLRGLEFHRPSHISHLASVYELCAAAVCDALPPSANVHLLRRPGSQKVKSGRWTAYRLYVNHDNPGYRLHYWRAGNSLWFMNVTLHDDYDIDALPEP